MLATLVELAERRGLAAVSPTVADIDDPDRLAFPLRRGLTWHRHARRSRRLGHGADHELLPGIAALFNGALFRTSTLDVIGVPDLRLFIRGDEVEMHRRLVRSGLPFGTALRAVYLHPRADGDDKPMLRRSPARPRPGRPGEALLHLPQPRLPHVAAGHAPGGPGSCPGSRGTSSSPSAARGSSRGGCGWCGRGAWSASTARESAQLRKTTVRSITKLMTVASPWAITQATLTRSGMAGSTASISALVPTLIANVVP